jgi:hypothetical protein
LLFFVVQMLFLAYSAIFLVASTIFQMFVASFTTFWGKFCCLLAQVLPPFDLFWRVFWFPVLEYIGMHYKRLLHFQGGGGGFAICRTASSCQKYQNILCHEYVTNRNNQLRHKKSY